MAIGGEPEWRGGEASLCHITGRDLGPGLGESTSCRCSHLILQLTKYYRLAHKNQSTKLPGVLNSRSCDQKQAGSGDGLGRLQQGQQLPLDPPGFEKVPETEQQTVA